MEEIKTGALICRRPDQNKQFSYEAIAFITGVPIDYTDADLKKHLNPLALEGLTAKCDDLIYRADIRSTSNEVQEEYHHLHGDSDAIPRIPFSRAKIEA